MKQNTHPTWFSDTKVFCDGVLIMITASTKEALYVDSWSGNHPSYQSQDSRLPTNNPNVKMFLRKSQQLQH